ncbi:MAG TPA: hypothetical protein VIP11_27575 [Gemmatimonadaceae bacterium]
MPIPDYQTWLKQTSLGTFSTRSSELKAVDEALAAYHRAATPYGKEWTANEARILFEIWKKKTGAEWKKHERNKNKMLEQLDRELPASKANRIGSGSVQEGKTATELRHATIYFLANCSTSAMPADLKGFLNDGTDTSADVQKGVNTSGAGDWRFDKSGFYDKANKRSHFLDDLSEKLIEYVKEMGKYLRDAASFMNIDGLIMDAVDFIRAGLPDLLIQVLGGLLSKIGAVVDVVKGIAQAGSAAIAIWKTRNWEGAILKGAPSEIISAVREQIKNSGYDGIKSAIKAGVLAGLSYIPAAGDVIAAIATAVANIYAFVTKVFDHFKEIRLLNALFGDAKTQLRGKLFDRPAAFNAWFKKAIASLPIVSSYCMTAPLTGSYYGFLTLVSTDGTELAYKQLERNYAMFNDVKIWAKKFVQDHSVKLYSSNVVVQHSISAAHDHKGAWDNMKGGFVTRAGKVAMGMIETATGS